MITEDKVTEIFFIADGFCKFFDAMMAKYTLEPVPKAVHRWHTTHNQVEKQHERGR